MKQYPIIALLFLLAINCAAKDSKAVRKNKKAIEKEEHHFLKDLRKNRDTAATYLHHANSLAAINSESRRAVNYYPLALKFDSSNTAIYRDYGKYLSDQLHSYTDARKVLEQGLALNATDVDMKKQLVSVNNMLALQAADNLMRDFGTTAVKELNPGGKYAVITKFDSLKLLIAEPGNKYNYQNLSARFLADDTTLRPDEMYMLIVGYSRQPFYNPFNYNDILEMRMMANHDVAQAIEKGLELTKTNPLNPTLNRELMYYYRRTNELLKADKYLNRVKQYFNGMLYSGNGSCDKPYISLWAKEEYNFITYLGLTSTDNHSMGMCAGQMAEVIDAINPATRKTEQVRFNVALIYMQTVGK